MERITVQNFNDGVSLFTINRPDRRNAICSKYSPSPRYMSHADYTKYAAETFLAEKEVIARLLSTAAATQK